MFLGERKQIIQDFILSEDDKTMKACLKKLRDAQSGDFYGMFKAMDGYPVIVRLLDPPLHEFLESGREVEVELAKWEARIGGLLSVGKGVIYILYLILMEKMFGLTGIIFYFFKCFIVFK